jgi:hypothetical protein
MLLEIAHDRISHGRVAVNDKNLRGTAEVHHILSKAIAGSFGLVRSDIGFLE